MAATTTPEPGVLSQFDQIKALEAEYLRPELCALPVALHRGKGCYVYDLEGNRYLDLISGIGVNSLGYAHPRITKVLREQAGLLIHSSNLYYHEYQGSLPNDLPERAVSNGVSSAIPARRRWKQP